MCGHESCLIFNQSLIIACCRHCDSWSQVTMVRDSRVVRYEIFSDVKLFFFIIGDREVKFDLLYIAALPPPLPHHSVLVRSPSGQQL